MFARIAGGRRARFPVARLLSENAGTKRRVQHNRKTGFHPANLSERNKKFARLSKIICRRSTTKAKRKLKFDAGINPGYVISQKIIHTLQCMEYEGAQWAYQVIRENKGVTNEVVSKIENEREMIEKEKKRFEKKIVKSFNKITQNKEWMAEKNEENCDDN